MSATQSETLNRIFRLTLLKGGGLALTLGLTMVQAAAFGAGPVLDAFLLIRQSLASVTSAVEGLLHKLLVPHFLARAQRGWGRLAAMPVLGAVLAAALLWWAAPVAVAALAPGFDAARSALAVELLRILVLGLPVTILVAVLSSRAFAQRRYSLVTASTLLPRLAGLAAFAAIGLTLSVTGLAWWIVGGMLAMGAVAIWAVRRPLPAVATQDAGPDTPPSPAPAPVPAHGRRALALLAFFGGQIALTWSNAYLASLGAAGTAALLFLSLRLLNAAPGMANTAVAKVYYTEYAASARGAADLRAARLAAGLRTGLFFALPVGGLLLVLADPLIAALLQRGAFTAQDTAAMAGLVRMLVPALILNAVLAGLYTAAVADDGLPLLGLTLWSGLAALALRVAVGLWAVPALGLAGLALAILIGGAAQTGIVAAICRRNWGALTGPGFAADVARLALAVAAAMAVAAAVAGLPLAVRLGLFGLVFIAAAIPCGVPEAQHLSGLLARRHKPARARRGAAPTH